LAVARERRGGGAGAHLHHDPRLLRPAAIAIYGITGWLIAQERTGAVLALQLLQNGLNIVLSVVLVLGLDLGVAGVAWATFVAEWAGLALGLWLCRAAFGVPDWRDWARVFDRAKLWRMAAVNVDILIRSLLLMAGFTSFLFFAADFGDVTLAANQVLIQFVYVTAYAMDGFAFAAEALVGQAMGARAAARLRRAAMLTSIWGMVVCAVMSALFLVAGGVFIDLMTTAEEVREGAHLPAMDGGGAAGGMRVVDVRRHLHRRDAHARHAQHDGGELRGLRGAGGPPGARLGQPRALGGDAGVLRAQGADARPEVSGAGAGGGLADYSYE
jgi:hypothetical protein